MRSLLKTGLGILFLALMAAVMALAFMSLGNGPGQPAALAPTPLPGKAPPTAIMVTVTWPAGIATPTGTYIPFLTNLIITPSAIISPGPAAFGPGVTALGPPPDYTPAPPPTRPPPLPTNTPLRATGGPYISEAEAIENTIRSCGPQNVNRDIPPRAFFAACRVVPALIGKHSTGAPCDREMWVVFVQGRFPPRKTLGLNNPDPVQWVQCNATMDATTGQISSGGLRSERAASAPPLLSEEQVVNNAILIARSPGNQLNESIPPKAVLTTAKNIAHITGHPRAAGDSDEETWVVTFEGGFLDIKDPVPPAGFRYETSDRYARLHVAVSAKSGSWHSIHVNDQIEQGQLIRK